MVTRSAACLKYTVFAFNFLVFLIGVFLVGMISYVYSEDVHGYTAVYVIVLLVGIVITVISFFGCWGAIRENSCLLITYAVVISLIIAVKIALGIALFSGFDYFKNAVARVQLNNTMHYNKTVASMEEWDFKQENWECCGANNFTDWVFVELIAASKGLVIPEGFNVYISVNKEYFNDEYGKREKENKALMHKLLQLYNEAKSSAAHRDKSLPQTCCAGNKKTNVSCHSGSKNLQREGCLPKTFEVFRQWLYTIGCVAIVIAVCEFLGVVIVGYLSVVIREEQNSPSRGN